MTFAKIVCFFIGHNWLPFTGTRTWEPIECGRCGWTGPEPKDDWRPDK